ncbi:hypothetical protein HRG_005943 [Hirsutella rhossiliensis]|uniref:Biotrophy-associated secreted protein 2 n=1 Tax=Hirsutella rhossiliensis TaxID=111463 RepID=A0A9P8MWL3_9HYPO|nr:uncharacterized protein HRG_05943 [Hirsutella rhossiliensis]KAH0963433.1 hypothetical protein HRG_05943 [Hirsutella rhossiliensis]
MVRSSVASLMAVALCAYALTADPGGQKNVGNGQGGQFITGRCLNNADCASNCCAQVNGGQGVCSGPQAAFQQGRERVSGPAANNALHEQ